MESKGTSGMADLPEESALNMFRQMDLKGKSKDDTQLKTVHQNTIATLRPYDESGGVLKKFSSKLIAPTKEPHSFMLTSYSKWCRWKGSDLAFIKLERRQ